jgi:hypothetical protein
MIQFKSRTSVDNSYMYSHVVTSYEINKKNTYLILKMIQLCMDFPMIENEKLHTTSGIEPYIIY